MNAQSYSTTQANKNKAYLILEGTLLVIAISVLFAYIKTYLPIEVAGNTENINNLIESNVIRVLSPLLFAPIAEEMVFRKWLPNTFQDVFGRKESIVLSNVLFTLFHLDPFFIPYLVNGFLYSRYYERSGDIKVPIIIHISYNVFIFLITFIVS